MSAMGRLFSQIDDLSPSGKRLLVQTFRESACPLRAALALSAYIARLVQRRETRHSVRHVVSGVAHVERRWTVDALGPVVRLE